MKKSRVNFQDSGKKNKRIKQVGAIIMVLFLVSTPLQANSQFKDIPEKSWYENHVSVLVNKGIISGYNDGNFHPYDNITAGQFIKTMVVALGYTDIENGSDYWATPYIDKAREIGLLDSTDFQTEVSQKAAITRGQMAKICKKTIIALEGERSYDFPSNQVVDVDDITDSADISKEIKDYGKVETSGYSNEIYDMYGLGVLKGYEDGTFKPSGNLSRAEAATVIHRVIDKSERDPFVLKVGYDINHAYINESEDRGPIYYDIDIMIFVDGNLEVQYDETEKYLTQLYNENTVNKIMEYVKKKKKSEEELNKLFIIDSNNRQIYIGSSEGNEIITIKGQTRYTVGDR